MQITPNHLEGAVILCEVGAVLRGRVTIPNDRILCFSECRISNAENSGFRGSNPAAIAAILKPPRIMNDEGQDVLIASFCFYFDIRHSLIGVHDSINEGSVALPRSLPVDPPLRPIKVRRAWSRNACMHRIEFNALYTTPVGDAHHTYRKGLKGQIQFGQVEVENVFVPANTSGQALGLSQFEYLAQTIANKHPGIKATGPGGYQDVRTRPIMKGTIKPEFHPMAFGQYESQVRLGE